MGGNRSLFTAFVGNVSFRATEDDLMDHFKNFNPVSARIPISEKTGGQKRYAYVRFNTADDVKSAIVIKNGSVLKGRVMKVDLAKNREGRSITI